MLSDMWDCLTLGYIPLNLHVDQHVPSQQFAVFGSFSIFVLDPCESHSDRIPFII
jgi:hypothetical protein